MAAEDRATMKKGIDALRQVHIELGNKRVVAWEAKQPVLRSLGRWTDPKALLRRIYEVEHPETAVPEGPGRQWQATWRGRFTPAARGKSRKAA
jgi:hypothetical protein